MKRTLGLGLLAVMVVAGLYGFVVTRQEARYLELIEQGDAALAKDDTVAAIEAFSVAIALKPDSMAGHLKRGDAYRRRKEFEYALKDLRRAAELDPLAPRPRELLGDVSSAMGHTSQAIERYGESLALDDRAPRVLYKLALSLLETGQAAAAVGELQRALKLDDEFAQAHYLLGVCLQELQRPAQAVSALERALTLDRGLLHAHEELAALYGRLNRGDQQNRHLEVLAGLDQRASREVALALGYAREGQIDRALVRMRGAVRQYPDEQQVHAVVGRLWLERFETGEVRDVKNALEALEQAVASDTPTSESLTLYGRALAASGQLTRAQRVLTDATKRFPVDPEAFLHLADVAEQRGQASVAQRAILDYAALEGLASPDLNANTLARIAEAYLKAGNIAGAKQALDRALKKEPANALALAIQERLK